MNHRFEPVMTERGVQFLFIAVSMLALWADPTVPHAVAQEPSAAPPVTAPSEEKPAEAAPTVEVAPQSPIPDFSGLVMQPAYLAVKVSIATVGALVGAVLWAASGGNQELAHKAWDPTMTGPWGWPDFVRGLASSNRGTP